MLSQQDNERFDWRHICIPILNGLKEVGLQLVQISNGFWYPEAWPFEIQKNGCNFVENCLKLGQKQWFAFSGFAVDVEFLGSSEHAAMPYKAGEKKTVMNLQEVKVKWTISHTVLCTNKMNSNI